MKKTASMILMMVFLHTLHSATFAQTPQTLKGTWVVDIKATEELFKNSPPPSQDLQWISLSSGLMFQMIYEFTDSAIAISAYTSEKKLLYQLLPGQDNKLGYVSEIKQAGRDDIWLVNIISDEHISISSSQSPATKYFILKRVTLDPNMRAEDGRRAFEAWKVWAPNMASILAPKTTFTWKEEVLLHDGKTIIVERSDTYDATMNHEIGQSAPLAEHKTTFMIPGTSQIVIWKSNNRSFTEPEHLNLLSLDILEGVPFVATTPSRSFAFEKWGRPNPPYVFFRYVGRWERIYLSEFPEEFKINVIAHSLQHEPYKKTVTTENREYGFVRAQTVTKINREPGSSKEYYSILRTPIDYGPPRQEYKGPKAPHPIAPQATTESPSGLEQGLSAFEEGKYDVAFGKLNPLSEAGVAMAQNIVGRMYLRGQGVPLDYNQALLLFRKAASQGLPNAQNNLGVMYAAGQGVQQDHKQAIVWFREAANQGYALAMNNLADMYMKGLGVNPDKAEANRWRAEARNAGFSGKKDIVEIKTVGDNEYKKGLESYYRWEFTEAARLFVEAAKKGHPEAQLILGIMYKHGQGVLKDETQGRYWIQRAKEQGHALDDTRDRVLIYDSSAENSNTIEKTPLSDALATMGCGCSKGTRHGNCKCSMR